MSDNTNIDRAHDLTGRRGDTNRPATWPTRVAGQIVDDDSVPSVTAVVRTNAGLVMVHSPSPAEVGRAALLVTVLPADGTRAVVRVAGELDLAVVDVLSHELDRQLSGGRRELLLELSGLRFCGCSGLGALLNFHYRLLAIGGTLILTGLDDAMVRLLRLTRLDEVLATRPARRRGSGPAGTS